MKKLISRIQGWDPPEWAKWLLLPLTIIFIIVGAIFLVLFCLFALIIGKREWAWAAVELAFSGFESGLDSPQEPSGEVFEGLG